MALFLISELAVRAYSVEQSYVMSQCDWSKMTRVEIDQIRLELSHKIGLTRLDPKLGWISSPGFDQFIDCPGWRHSKLSVTSRGFRSNGVGSPFSGETIDPSGVSS
jgi:hypothetical protein